MATSRYKAERFIESLKASVQELLDKSQIDADDVTVSAHVKIEDLVGYSTVDD